MDADPAERIREFQRKNRQFVIAYGGDGTVLDAVNQTAGKKAIIPVRNYGLCGLHKNYLDGILDGKLEKQLKLTLCPFLEYSFNAGTFKNRGIAEVTVKNEDPTCAVRFNLHVDNRLYMKNVIADGIVLSTSYGSTGYFKSVARCIFNMDAIGIAFIAPTQGINNLVLNSTSRIKIEFIRPAEVVVTADKSKDRVKAGKDDCIEVERTPDQVSIFGLDEFHCQECRALRHSIVEAGIAVQDQYTV